MIVIIILLLIILLLLIYLLIIKPLLMPSNAMSRYHFSVEWGGTRIGFMEVSGLDIEIETVTYRDSASLDDSVRKIPGLRKYANLILKREIVKGDNEFFNWINTKQVGVIEKRDVRISLLDHQHAPIIIWKIKNAFPIQYLGPVLNAASSEVALETLVLTHEGIVVETT